MPDSRFNPRDKTTVLRSVEQDNPEEPVDLQIHAIRNLRYIRETIEATRSFTRIPGVGGVAMGLVGVTAALLSSVPQLAPYWAWIWLAAAPMAATCGGLLMAIRARRAGWRLGNGTGRKFLLSLCPPLLAGAILTPVLAAAGVSRMIPGMWLLLYGAGVTSAGIFSSRAISLMGLLFMLLGVIALWAPYSWGNAMLGAGFGVLHIVFGLILAAKQNSDV